jgi:NAD(P)H-dependent nitrite reductase small subunit
MGRWIKVLEADALPPGQARTVTAGETRLALFNDAGRFFAIDDACPHQGASLGEGVFHEGRVICPWHSWVYDVKTGQCPRDSHESVNVYPTRHIDGSVEVEIPVSG